MGAGQGVPAGRITGSTGSPERAERLTKDLGVPVGQDPGEAARGAASVLLAVPPSFVGEVAGKIAPGLRSDAVVVSLAAEVPLAEVADQIGDVPAVRAMTNLPVALGVGMTVLSAPEPGELLAKVATPGGTTRAAMDALDHDLVAQGFAHAVEAAVRKAEPDGTLPPP
ncbi:NAD(P)-binding domain-containing protein [Actinocorallia sp. API 0066]|uniref:pyrroline-5-carboxylate reductase family protein n=1 Tax=Actinocorallia sp. API 0066 TaxID=2896846 RepID=UPI001E624ECE|nr:pyrroline-5-carboxylate reductase dimerization domain-containing protein [Actinocorallia sp. API 0066]MCD0449791.1 NAD(P)-binding domain-containing protein [Actinocorallia sp. API 0066]